MGKNTMSFLSKLLGKKKEGCCGVVVEEVNPEEQTDKPTGTQESKDRPQKSGAESTSTDS